MSVWTDLVGKEVDKLIVLDANVEQLQTTHNHVIPRAAGGPSDLRGWKIDPRNLWDEFKTEPRQGPLLGGALAARNHVSAGVSWRYGGQWEGKGRYIRDAFAWARVHSIGAAQRFFVSVSWNDPAFDGPDDDPIAVITCDMTVTWEQFSTAERSWAYHFVMRGDGSGHWTPAAG